MKIEGVYKFFQDGKCIGEQKNNITETGRILAIKTLMGAVPSFGGSIHLGVDGSYNTYNYAPSQVLVNSLFTPTAIAVSGTTPTQTVVVTFSSHTLSVGNIVSFSGITAVGITGLNSNSFTVASITATTVTFVSSVSLTNGTYTTNIGTLTTSTPMVTLTVSSHTLSVGSTISISGNTNASLTTLNGTTQVVTAITSTTITFVNASSLTNGTYTTGLGTFGNLATNTRMGFRVNSTPVLSSNIDNSVSYDAILFKAKVEDPSAYKIYEVGLYSDSLTSGARSNKNELVVSFDAGQLVLDSTGADFATSGSVTRILSNTESSSFRIGSQALQVVVGSAAKTASAYDLSNTSDTDMINLAFYSTAANAANYANVYFYTGAAYNKYSFAAPLNQYYVLGINRNTPTTTSGTVDWSNITKIVFESIQSTMIFDGLRIEKPIITDTLNGLVSRAALTTPITKNEKSPLDIEYHMRLSFNG